MIKRFKQSVLTSLLIASLGLSYNAQADIKIYVKNCSGSKMDVDTFNAKDDSWISPYQSKSISHNDSKKMKCKGQGVGRCRINTDCSLSKGSIKTRVKKNKWIKITACDSYEDKNSSTEPSCD